MYNAGYKLCSVHLKAGLVLRLICHSCVPLIDSIIAILLVLCRTAISWTSASRNALRSKEVQYTHLHLPNLHTCHFSGHFPGKSGLAGCYLTSLSHVGHGVVQCNQTWIWFLSVYIVFYSVFRFGFCFFSVSFLQYCAISDWLGRTFPIWIFSVSNGTWEIALNSVDQSWLLLHTHTHTHTQPCYGPFLWPVREENFWTLWSKGRLTEADTLTIRLRATPSGLTSAHLHHPPIILRAGCPSCRPTNSV